MAATQTEIESQTIQLSAEAFKAFCEDISGMFGVDMECSRQEVCTETVEGLKQRFKELVAVNSIETDGALEGIFQVVFDQRGLFTLSGVVVMPDRMNSLCERFAKTDKILVNLEHGTLKEAKKLNDAMAEACNMLVGTWDRVFREGLPDHGHFTQSGVFIGDPWNDIKKKLHLAADEELLFAPYKMRISTYPAFDCGVIFPKNVFSRAETEEKFRAEAEAKARAEAEEKAEAEAEEKAKAGAEERAKAEAGRKEDIEREARAKVEAELKAEAEAREKTKAEAEEKTRAEIEEKIRTEAEAKARAEAEEGGKVEAELKAEAEEKAKAEAEEKAKAETEEKVKVEAEEKTTSTDDSKEQPVSETVSEMLQSPVVLSGEAAAISSTVCAKDVMEKNIVWGGPDDSVQQTLTKMQQNDSGYLMVGTDDVLEGIVSKSDITGAISPYLRPVFARWRRPLDDATLQIKIKWIMSRPVRTIKPEASVAAIVENMRQFGGRCLPIVDNEGKMQGLVTAFDIFKLLSSSSDVSSAGKTPQAPQLVQLDL